MLPTRSGETETSYGGPWRSLLDRLGEGFMTSIAYDTAWLARLRHPGAEPRPLFPSALDWMRRHQWPDGSWGGTVPVVHDRLISTVSAVVALSDAEKPDDRPAIERGLRYLQRLGTEIDGSVELVAFELLYPALVEDARRLGLEVPDGGPALQTLRAEKERMLPAEVVHARKSPLLHSAEYLRERGRAEALLRHQAPNGSIACSPSATAYVYRQVPEERALAYLNRVVAASLGGGACNVFPFDVFERAWVLYNLLLSGDPLPDRRHLQYLCDAWTPDGVGFASAGLVPDADDTALVLAVLQWSGKTVDIEPLRRFERADGFACFEAERSPSVSTNVHVLAVLKDLPPDPEGQRLVNKAVTFLADARRDGGYWLDKWHISPLYTTAHGLIAALGVAPDLAASALRWVVAAQNEDGSWGKPGTDEETAYAVQGIGVALQEDAPLVERIVGEAAAIRCLQAGAAYLKGRLPVWEYPELWVGKGLYAPVYVVRSAVLSACRIADRLLLSHPSYGTSDTN